jgi:site-specific DNA recombinase
MRVATYTRISTDEERQPYSLEAQAQRLGNYIASQDGWQRVRAFTDQGSGATLERPQLQRALADARAGTFDLLLVYRVDRLARSVRGLAQILEELDGAGVAFRSATEPFDTTTPAGRMMVQMLGVFAEFERATIIDRVINGMERKAARGGWTSGSHPFGYAADADSGFLVPLEAEAPLVPVIFELYAKKRLGARSVANWLNSRGYRTRNGRPWSHMSVLTVLRNRAYLGEVFFRGTYHPAPHQPLVDPDLFAAAQAVLRERGEDHSRRASNPSDYLLSGVLVCGRCGKHFVGTAAQGRSARYRYYTCFTRHRYGAGRCDVDRLPAPELDAGVLEALYHTYQRHELLDEAAERSRLEAEATAPRYHEERAAVDDEIAKAEEAIERYLLAFEAKTLPEAQCSQRVRSLAEKLADLRCRRAELTALLDTGDTPARPRDVDLQQIREHIRDVIEQGDRRTSKALVRKLVHEVRVGSREDIVPTFRVPTDSVLIVDGVVEVAGVEPASSKLFAGLLRAQPARGSQMVTDHRPSMTTPARKGVPSGPRASPSGESL